MYVHWTCRFKINRVTRFTSKSGGSPVSCLPLAAFPHMMLGGWVGFGWGSSLNRSKMSLWGKDYLHICGWTWPWFLWLSCTLLSGIVQKKDKKWLTRVYKSSKYLLGLPCISQVYTCMSIGFLFHRALCFPAAGQTTGSQNDPIGCW